jgi:hypothetical protein
MSNLLLKPALLSVGGLTILRFLIPPQDISFYDTQKIKYSGISHRNCLFFDYTVFWKDDLKSREPMFPSRCISWRRVNVSHWDKNMVFYPIINK